MMELFLKISGRVHGVGFRYQTKKQAMELGSHRLGAQRPGRHCGDFSARRETGPGKIRCLGERRRPRSDQQG
ncbi:MAG: hypothetical protein A2846_02185 [Candidatus Doudnabacteria bacterium RIFCSPHIGHO2_01_FULL_49_9]|uniref:Acylphosphatase-like domain-containing protein n=1 Tax=Candidatus Doudnabacteria bacterium RIFCSPHIGHO2_01_FULL_49_9 TaxID=1817827 RepID=A0A1F5NZ98_9BACT|nr:MAG: hypothetical protein A2846_02185 [Candidatus Doudnabacteria bacterium RIFCSPHIGHO2_01_FULL_49_9]